MNRTEIYINNMKVEHVTKEVLQGIDQGVVDYSNELIEKYGDQ